MFPPTNARGFGIGLRPAHYRSIERGFRAGTSAPATAAGDDTDAAMAADVAALARIDWFEAISENFFGAGGNARRMLRLVRERVPVVLHGVSLSVGSVDPLDAGYLQQLGALVREIEPAWVSDHLCWGGVDNRLAHDLLPLPYSEEALAHVATRIQQVQDHLGRAFVVENVSSYVAFAASTMTEWEFLAALVARTGCQLLLDVNNVFVSAHNHGFDARAFLAGLPLGAVAQIHLAGHSTRGDLLLDTHDHPVRDEVWALYQAALARFGAVPTLIEWDDKIPPLARVVQEADRARVLAGECPAFPARLPMTVPMDDLASLQRRFFAVITAREEITVALDRLGLSDADAAALVHGDERLDAVGRLGIYNDMYFFRLLAVIEEDYPWVAAVLGEDDFRDVVGAYLEALPPRDHALRNLGLHLPSFLAGHAVATGRPWLRDLAALEWARADVLDRADAIPLSGADLQALAPTQFPSLVMQAVPAVILLDVSHAVDALAAAIVAGADIDAAVAAAVPDSAGLLVWRVGAGSRHRRVDADEASLLPALLGDAPPTFGEICERLAQGRDDEEAAQRAFQLLVTWVHAGLLRQAAP